MLVRHLKSCKAKTGGSNTTPGVPPRRRGRKRKSCDACSRAKRACSGSQPCASCAHRKQPCSFPGSSPANGDPDRIKDAPSNDADESSSGEDWDTKLLAPLSQVDSTEQHMNSDVQGDFAQPPFSSMQYYPMPAPLPFGAQTPLGLDPSNVAPGPHSCSLDFLANFTNTKGMANSFDCGTVQERSGVMHVILSNPRSYHEQYSDDTGLRVKTHIIVSAIKDAVESHRRRNAAGLSWSYTVELACSNFFAPANLHRLIVAYWAFWHPNCAIVHKPSFSLAAAPATLVTTMALIGACMSPDNSDRESALFWLDYVEEWVFSSASFNDDPLPCDPQDVTNPVLQDRLDAMRAAYCAILLQTWEGTEEAKRRARRSRYTDIIGAFRSVCSRSVTHGDLQSYFIYSNPEISWKQFSMREELIRTLTYIVLLDTAYVIFNNTPSRMALQEARMSLACPEACWQAEDVRTWQEAMKVWATTEIGMQQPTISQIICLIWNSRLTERDWAMLRQMSTVNLFAIVHRKSKEVRIVIVELTRVLALHVQLFHIRCHPMPGNQTLLLRQALDNWKLVHSQRTGVLDLPESTSMEAHDWWKRPGFPRFAFEYWSLADFILSSCETVSFADVNHSRNVNESLVSQLLSRYDESDMTQVHDLVNIFSGMNLML